MRISWFSRNYLARIKCDSREMGRNLGPASYMLMKWYYIPFRKNKAATSRQVVLECYCIVSDQLIMEQARRGQRPELCKFIILFKYWLLGVYNVCESDTNANGLKIPFAVTIHILSLKTFLDKGGWRQSRKRYYKQPWPKRFWTPS